MCESSRLLAQIVLAARRACKFARNYDPLGRFLRPLDDSEEKHEPATDIDTVVVDSLKALDPQRPIREANCYPKGALADERTLL